MTDTMTDEELMAFLGVGMEHADKVLPTITPERRALYDKMRRIEWFANGKGPREPGVLYDYSGRRW
jgi:hypothetical protein